MTARPLARGDVVLISFPFTDLSGDKVRPAIVVGRVLGEDLVLAFLTSRTSNADSQADVLLESDQAEFLATGLKAASVVRLSKLATLHRDLARRRIGIVGPATLGRIGRALRYVFEL